MAKPNSLTTLLRRALVEIIEPLPGKDEAWCQDCKLNNGQTLVLHGSIALMHLERHKELADPYVSMIGRNIHG